MQQDCLPHHVQNHIQVSMSEAALRWQEGDTFLKRRSLSFGGRGSSEPAHASTIWGLSASKGVPVAYLYWYLMLHLAASARCLCSLLG